MSDRKTVKEMQSDERIYLHIRTEGKGIYLFDQFGRRLGCVASQQINTKFGDIISVTVTVELTSPDMDVDGGHFAFAMHQS